MASDQKTPGAIRICTPRQFESLLRRTLQKPLVSRPSPLRIVWSRPRPAVEVDPLRRRARRTLRVVTARPTAITSRTRHVECGRLPPPCRNFSSASAADVAVGRTSKTRAPSRTPTQTQRPDTHVLNYRPFSTIKFSAGIQTERLTYRKGSGSGAWTRTKILGSKGPCATNCTTPEREQEL